MCSIITNLKTLYSYRELLLTWTVRDIKVRYKQSLLGVVWAVLQPLSVMAIFSVIFTYIVKIPMEDVPYPIFSYTALLPWIFFTSAISYAVPSLVNNMSLVTKIYLPREIFPIAAIGASSVDFLVATLVFAGMMVVYGVPFTITLVAVPLLLAIQIFLTFGIVLIGSALNVYYRDVRFVVPLVLQLWMYATPVIYPLSQVPERFRAIYMLNPMAGLIEAYRAVALRGMWPNWSELGVAAAISVALFIVGYAYFKRAEWEFADII